MLALAAASRPSGVACETGREAASGRDEAVAFDALIARSLVHVFPSAGNFRHGRVCTRVPDRTRYRAARVPPVSPTLPLTRNNNNTMEPTVNLLVDVIIYRGRGLLRGCDRAWASKLVRLRNVCGLHRCRCDVSGSGRRRNGHDMVESERRGGSAEQCW